MTNPSVRCGCNHLYSRHNKDGCFWCACKLPRPTIEQSVKTAVEHLVLLGDDEAARELQDKYSTEP